MSTEIAARLQQSIESAIPGAQVRVDVGSPGHYSLSVTSSVFEGKTTLQRHRLVMSAIAPLMAGDAAPVHAIDTLEAKTS
jgi:stress-induced morphogen